MNTPDIGQCEKQNPICISREISFHKDGGNLNEGIAIFTTDSKGPGGAYHRYDIVYADKYGQLKNQQINFQCGTVPENGINGISQEVLLAILIDRLHAFINGPYPSKETAEAHNYCCLALEALKRRTQDRIQRGVLGKYEK